MATSQTNLGIPKGYPRNWYFFGGGDHRWCEPGSFCINNGQNSKLSFYLCTKTMDILSHEDKCFRELFITTLKANHPKIPPLYRSTHCLAISLSDIFQYHLILSNAVHILPQIDIELYTLATQWIAVKLHSYPHLKLNKFISNHSLQMKYNDLAAQIIQMETLILKHIDFDIPLVTAYDILDSEIPPSQYMSGVTKKKVVRCLKIFMNCLEESPILSLKPELGKQFYKITKTGNGSKLGCTLYQNSRKAIIARQQAKQF